jgi:alpha-L-rhamnosidase
MDVASFFTKWTKDVSADQYPNGSVPHVIPDVLTRPGNVAAGSAGWADAAVIVPWTMYLSYRDRRILEDQYGTMTRWLEPFGCGRGRFHLDGDVHFGDWLAYTPYEAGHAAWQRPPANRLIATAFFAPPQLLRHRPHHLAGKRNAAAAASSSEIRPRSRPST